MRDSVLDKIERRARPTFERLFATVRDPLYDGILRRLAVAALIRRTSAFTGVTWLGKPIWQNPLDAWQLQEALVELEIDLVIECGTNRGGSASFMASIFDLLDRGRIITIDVESLATDIDHPRIEFLVGSSTADEIVDRVRALVDELQPRSTLVLLDSDHAAPHVRREMERYAEFVPVGGYMLVQDGCIDEIGFMRLDRPGPLVAIEEFVAQDSRFEIDHQRSTRFLFSHSPSGWLRRTR